MIYLSINGDDFGFKNDIDPNIVILPTDIVILNETYEKYLKENQTKDYKIADAHGETFERMFTEVIPEVVIPTEDTTQISELQNTMDAIIMSLL